MIRRAIFIVLSFALLFSFALYSKFADSDVVARIDFDVAVKLQERIDTSTHLRFTRAIGEVMEASTFFASPIFSVGAIGLITLIGFVKEKKWKKKIRILAIPILFALLVVGEMYGKSVVHHPAPPFFMIKNPTTIFPKYYINDEFSYPSGHAARAVFLALCIWFLAIKSREAGSGSARQFSNKKIWKKKLWIGITLGIYVGLVFVSRIYLGHHWLSDVIGGTLLGSALGFLVLFAAEEAADRS